MKRWDEEAGVTREPSLAELEALRKTMQRCVIATMVVVTLLLAGAFHLTRQAPPDAPALPAPEVIATP